MAGIEQRIRHLVGLQESILHEDITADMMCVAAPINIGRGSHLMLGDILRQGKEGISDLRLVLDVGFVVAFNSDKRIYRPDILLILGLHITETFDSERLIAIVVTTVAGVEPVGATDAEIEVASRERMTEIETDARVAIGTPSPLCPMIGIDIEDAILAVVEMICEIEQRIGVPQSATHISVVLVGGGETHRLTEKRIGVESRRESGIIIGVNHFCGRQSGLLHFRTDVYLARRLHNRLKLTLHRHIAGKGGILGKGTMYD